MSDDDDFVGAAVLWVLAAYAMSLVAVAALAVGLVALVAYGIFLGARAIYRALMPEPTLDDYLLDVYDERARAIEDILEIRRTAIRRMRDIADEDAIEGHGRELRRRS